MDPAFFLIYLLTKVYLLNSQISTGGACAVTWDHMQRGGTFESAIVKVCMCVYECVWVCMSVYVCAWGYKMDIYYFKNIF